ncbi:MAG: DUF411 domain-containing protein [Deltaproteobacteria bacterium]|nr:DUF411 domain-containing protein [Deltaproteobacteria bacterium]
MHDENLQQIKNKNGVMKKIESCHTGIIEGYVIEGHVPAKDIQRLLKEKPKIAGIAVPGMPQGSPGMEGHGYDSFHTLSFESNGKIGLYSSHE